MQDFWNSIISNPTYVYIILTVAIFLVVYILGKLGFLKDGDYKRIGVIVATYLLSSVTPEEMNREITALVTGALSVFLNELGGWLKGLSPDNPPPG